MEHRLHCTAYWDTMRESRVNIEVQNVRQNTLFKRETFDARFELCTDEMLAFLKNAGVSYEGANIIDIGSGDGAIDLGISTKGRCRGRHRSDRCRCFA